MRSLLTTAIIIAALPVLAAEDKEELVELEIDLPRPLFIGTPTNITSDNLEAPRSGKREPLLVPEGVRNVARDKPVTSSDDDPIIGELWMITDGDKEGGGGSYVELGPGPQWVQIDLEEPHTVYGIAIWHFHSQARVYKDVVVQLGDDVDFIENVRTIFNNDHDNSSGLGIGEDKEWVETYEGRLIRLEEPQDARFIRLHSNGSTASPMNHYIEVEVYGLPAEE